jgi:hypothetical protein
LFNIAGNYIFISKKIIIAVLSFNFLEKKVIRLYDAISHLNRNIRLHITTCQIWLKNQPKNMFVSTNNIIQEKNVKRKVGLYEKSWNFRINQPCGKPQGMYPYTR